MMKNTTKCVLLALLLCGMSGLALAGSSTGSLSITATVAQTCSVFATSTLAFGAYEPVDQLCGQHRVGLDCRRLGVHAERRHLERGGGTGLHGVRLGACGPEHFRAIVFGYRDGHGEFLVKGSASS